MIGCYGSIFKADSNSDSIHVSFFYLTQLNIVTVQGRTNLAAQKTFAGEVLEVGANDRWIFRSVS